MRATDASVMTDQTPLLPTWMPLIFVQMEPIQLREVQLATSAHPAPLVKAMETLRVNVMLAKLERSVLITGWFLLTRLIAQKATTAQTLARSVRVTWTEARLSSAPLAATAVQAALRWCPVKRAHTTMILVQLHASPAPRAAIAQALDMVQLIMIHRNVLLATSALGEQSIRKIVHLELILTRLGSMIPTNANFATRAITAKEARILLTESVTQGSCVLTECRRVRL